MTCSRAAAGTRRAFPQTRAKDDCDYYGGDGADHEQGEAGRPEPVGKTPDVARDKREHRRRKRGHQRPGQPDSKPPRPVGPQHAEEEAQVAGDDPGNQAEPVTVGRYGIAEFLEPPGYRAATALYMGGGPTMGTGRGVRIEVCQVGVPNQRRDQPDERIRRAPGHADGAERGQREHSDTVSHARVRDHRSPSGL